MQDSTIWVSSKPKLKLMLKLQQFIKVMKMSKIERAKYKMLLQAENLYLRSAIEHKRVKIEELISNAREERTIDQQEQVEYNELEIEYSKRKPFNFIHKNFPSENESGSEAHRLAIWWAKQSDIMVGDQTLISMNDKWYLVEKFDDADNGYQVEARITEKQYANYIKEWNNGNGRAIQSVQRSASRLVALDKRSNTIAGEKHSVDSLQVGYERKDSSIQRVGDRTLERWGTTSNRSGDSESSGSNKQEAQYSLKDSLGKELSAEQAEFFKDSKVRDDNGNLLVVYHGTHQEFYTFDKSKIKIDNLGRGFYLVDKKSIAESYARRRTQERGGKEKVLATYINAKKPFNTDNITKKEALDYLEYDYLHTGTNKQIEEAKKYAQECIEDIDILTQNGTPDYSLLFSTKEENFQFWLKNRGYDAIVISGQDKVTNEEGVAYVVFDSNQIKLTTNLKPTSDEDIRYSRKPFAEQVDEVLQGKDTTSTHLKIMDTPKILQDIGLSNLPILMTAKHLFTTVNDSGRRKGNYHGLGVEIIKQLPQLIKEPVLVAESLTRDDSIVLLTKAVDNQERPIIIAMKPNGNGRIDNVLIEANIMLSTYGRNNFDQFVQRLVEDNKVLYWNKKRSQDLSVNPRLQLPSVITNLASDTIIRTINRNSQVKNENFTKNDIRYSLKDNTAIEDTAEYEDTIFFMEELKRAISQGGRTTWSTSSILRETLRNTPSIDIISRLNNGEERIGQAFAHYLSNKNNIQELEDLLYFLAQRHILKSGSLSTREVLRDMPKLSIKDCRRLPIHKQQ